MIRSRATPNSLLATQFTLSLLIHSCLSRLAIQSLPIHSHHSRFTLVALPTLFYIRSTATTDSLSGTPNTLLSLPSHSRFIPNSLHSLYRFTPESIPRITHSAPQSLTLRSQSLQTHSCQSQSLPISSTATPDSIPVTPDLLLCHSPVYTQFAPQPLPIQTVNPDSLMSLPIQPKFTTHTLHVHSRVTHLSHTFPSLVTPIRLQSFQIQCCVTPSHSRLALQQLPIHS